MAWVPFERRGAYLSSSRLRSEIVEDDEVASVTDQVQDRSRNTATRECTPLVRNADFFAQRVTSLHRYIERSRHTQPRFKHEHVRLDALVSA